MPETVNDFRVLASERLGRFPHFEVNDPDVRRAAVLLCVVDAEQGPAVIVIKRAYRGRNAGQWGLPGGRLDAGETAAEAAVRELHEELGLTAAPADLLGRLDDFPAASGFVITPIVAALDDVAELAPSPDEVHSVHLVDLARLAADDVPHWVDRESVLRTVLADMRLDAERVQGSAGADDVAQVAGSVQLNSAAPELDSTAGLLQMRLGPEMTIHAPTGAMLWQFREIVLLGRDPADARVAHFAQPDWTQH